MQLSKKRIIRGLLLSVSISLLTIITLLFVTGEDFSIKIFAEISSIYLLISAIIIFFHWLLKAIRLRLLTDMLGGKIAFRRIFAIVLASRFVGHVTPSSAGALPVSIYFLNREGLPAGKSAALHILNNFLSFACLIIAGPILFLIWGSYLPFREEVVSFFYLFILIFIIFLLLFIYLTFNTKFYLQVFNWLLDKKILLKFFPAEKLTKFKKRLEEQIILFRKSLKILIENSLVLTLLIILSIAQWLMFFSLAPVLLTGMQLDFSIPAVILAQLIFILFRPLIPTPGGSGGTELGFAYLFKFMIPNYFLGIFVALWQFFMFYVSLVIGGVLFIHLLKNDPDLWNR